MNNQKVYRVVIVCNAPMDSVAEELLIASARRQSTRTVGVDGGAKRLVALGVLPDVVTGDFDSLTDEDLQYLEAQGVMVVPTPDQDYTDLDKALTYIRDQFGNVSVEIFGAVGGRLDHTYSVLSAVIKHGVLAGMDIRLIDSVGEIIPVRDGESILQGEDLPGRVVSLLTLGIVRDVTLTGVKWTLNGDTLAPGKRDGTLNEITDTMVTVRCERDAPLLLLIHHCPLPERVMAR